MRCYLYTVRIAHYCYYRADLVLKKTQRASFGNSTKLDAASGPEKGPVLVEGFLIEMYQAFSLIVVGSYESSPPQHFWKTDQDQMEVIVEVVSLRVETTFFFFWWRFSGWVHVSRCLIKRGISWVGPSDKRCFTKIVCCLGLFIIQRPWYPDPTGDFENPKAPPFFKAFQWRVQWSGNGNFLHHVAINSGLNVMLQSNLYSNLHLFFAIAKHESPGDSCRHASVYTTSIQKCDYKVSFAVSCGSFVVFGPLEEFDPAK